MASGAKKKEAAHPPPLLQDRAGKRMRGKGLRPILWLQAGFHGNVEAQEKKEDRGQALVRDDQRSGDGEQKSQKLIA